MCNQTIHRSVELRCIFRHCAGLTDSGELAKQLLEFVPPKFCKNQTHKLVP
jgi:hypothetical protein